MITVALLMGMFCARPDTAAAQTVVYDCSNTQYSSNVVLGANIDTTWDGICIMVKQGYDVDFANKTITCTDASCGTAVSGLNAGDNWVYNGAIVGPWAYGAVDVRRVFDMTIQANTACIKTTGTVEMTRVEDNTLIANGWAVDIKMSGNTDAIRNNYIQASINGIRVVGRSTSLSGTGPTVEENLVNTTTVGIHQSGADKKLVMINNEIDEIDLGPDPIPFIADNIALAETLAAWHSNVCSDHAYCPGAPLCSNSGVVGCLNNVPYCAANP